MRYKPSLSTWITKGTPLRHRGDVHDFFRHSAYRSSSRIGASGGFDRFEDFVWHGHGSLPVLREWSRGAARLYFVEDGDVWQAQSPRGAFPSFPRSHAPAWERTSGRSASRLRRLAPRSGGAGVPTRSVGTRSVRKGSSRFRILYTLII